MIQTNVASLSAYCVRACKIKHLTEREFSGIFSLAGEFCVFKTGIPGGLDTSKCTLHRIRQNVEVTGCPENFNRLSRVTRTLQNTEYRRQTSGVSVSVFEVGIGIRYFSIVYNFWSNKATAGPPGIPVLKTQNSPRQRKNSRDCNP